MPYPPPAGSGRAVVVPPETPPPTGVRAVVGPPDPPPPPPRARVTNSRFPLWASPTGSPENGRAGASVLARACRADRGRHPDQGRRAERVAR